MNLAYVPPSIRELAGEVKARIVGIIVRAARMLAQSHV